MGRQIMWQACEIGPRGTHSPKSESVPPGGWIRSAEAGSWERRHMLVAKGISVVTEFQVNKLQYTEGHDGLFSLAAMG